MEYLTTGDVARALGVSLNTVKSWIHKGMLDAVRLPSGHHRIPRSELDRILGRWSAYEGWRGSRRPEPEELDDLLDWVEGMLDLARATGPLAPVDLEEKERRLRRLHRALEVVSG